MYGVHRYGQAGYTLVELLVVCGIVGLLLTFAVGGYRSAADNLRLSNAATAMAADIRLAQARAQQEGKRSRVVFDIADNSYELQLATTGTAAVSCSSTDYASFKRVNMSDLRVNLDDLSLGCLTFEPTGRTGWANPRVDRSITTQPDPYKPSLWTMFLNGDEAPWDVAVGMDHSVNTWTDPVDGTVTVVIDLGQVRHVDQICPQVIRDVSDSVPLPRAITLWKGNVTGNTAPADDEWTELITRTAPYPEEIVSQNGVDWSKACPVFQLDQSLRYLRFVFTADQWDSWSLPAMALDEIKVDAPGLTLRGARGDRRLTITPVTGRVVVN